MPDHLQQLLADYDEWADERSDLSVQEDQGIAQAKDWERSDDSAAALLGAIVAEIRASQPEEGPK